MLREKLQKRRWAEEESGAEVARVTGKCNSNLINSMFPLHRQK